MTASRLGVVPSAHSTPVAVRRVNIGLRLEESGVAGGAYGRDGDDVAEGGDAAGVGAAFVEGAAAGGGRVEEGAAVDVVGAGSAAGAG